VEDHKGQPSESGFSILRPVSYQPSTGFADPREDETLPSAAPANLPTRHPAKRGQLAKRSAKIHNSFSLGTPKSQMNQTLVSF
jgi:hypothetical protein